MCVCVCVWMCDEMRVDVCVWMCDEMCVDVRVRVRVDV